MRRSETAALEANEAWGGGPDLGELKVTGELKGRKPFPGDGATNQELDR
jgi:hypothetical protein